MYRILTMALVFTFGLVAFGGTAVMSAQRTHPYLYLTADDVARGKQNIERFPWAKQAFDELKARADKWTAMSDEQIRGIIPPPESLFAYGFSGCPSCGKTWPLWGLGGICTLDKPGKVTCPSCSKVFPDAEHPDDGKGWHDAKSGRTYYFVAIYNTYISQTLTLTALDDLSNAYALTGDEKYAHAAAVMFDAIAKIYPTCTIGSIDYPGHPGGRFERTLYQVARVLVFFSRYYDLIYNSPSMDAPSLAGESTVRKSIEERILKNGSAYCFEHGRTGKNGLTNGEADFVRGVMCVGLVLDMPEYVDWCVSGPYSIFNFLENNLHRDGQYYETSNLYSSHALGLYRDMGEMLINYRSEKYPSGINIYEHPKFSRALVQGLVDVLCAGHTPRYGDSGPDVGKLESAPDVRVAQANAEHMYHRATSPEEKARWADMLNRISDGNVEKAREASGSFKSWLLYHAEPVAKSEARVGMEPSESFLLDGKGLAILRSGTGVNGRAAFVRYGPSVTHGHKDDLNLNFFALGRELTYDFGYSLGSAHVQTGWAKQTGSHNLVMVNEQGQLAGGPTGGSAELFATSNAVKMTELSCDDSYKSEGVDVYSRTLALIDTDAKNSYLVDIFRVHGGKTHDLLWHALGDSLDVQGAEQGGVEPGSLASPDYEWGSKVGPDGDINGQAEKGPYWTAPPANGYGFLYNIHRGPASGPLSATWTVDADAGEKLKVDLLAPEGCEVISAEAPGILPALPHANFAILRRNGEDLKSTFTSILQPYAGQNPVRKVEGLKADKSEGDPVGVKVQVADGRTDYIFSSLSPTGLYSFSGADDAAVFRGRFGFARFAGESVDEMVLVGTSQFSVRSLSIECRDASYWGEILSVDYDKCTIVVNRELDAALVGEGIYINRAGYGRSSYYRIRSVNREKGRTIIGLDTGTLILGTGLVGTQAAPGSTAIDNLVPLEVGTSCMYLNTGYFRGKLLVAEDGTKAQISDVKGADGKRIILTPDAPLFKGGQHLRIYDIQPGDRFEISTSVKATRTDEGLCIRSTTQGKLRIGGREAGFHAGTTVFSP